MRRSRFEPCAGNNIFFHFYCLRLGLLLINPRNIISNIVMIFLNNFKGSWSATHVLLPRGWGAYVSPLLQCNQCTMFIRKNKIIIIILNKIIIIILQATVVAMCHRCSKRTHHFLSLSTGRWCDKHLSQSAFSLAAGVCQFSQSKFRNSTGVDRTTPVCLRVVFNSTVTAFRDDPIVAWRLIV